MDAAGDRRRHRHSAHPAGAELPADPRPSQRTRAGQAAARDAEPDASWWAPARTVWRFPRRAAINRTRRCCRCCSTSVEYGLNAQSAVEKPRFQIRAFGVELRQSRNEARRFAAGRAPAAGRVPGIAAARHKVEVKSRYDSGSAPVLIRHVSQRRDRGRRATRFTSGSRRHGRRDCSTSPASFDRDGLAGKLRALAAAEHLHRRQLVEVRGLAGADLYARAVPGARPVFARLFEQECLREYAETFPTVCGDFAFYQFPSRGILAQPVRRACRESFRFAFKVPEQITCKVFPPHARYGPQAGKENEAFWTSACCKEMFLRPLLPYREKTALLIFEFGAFGRRSFAEAGRVSGSPGPVSGGAAAGVPLRRGDPQSGVSGEGLLLVPAQRTGWRTCTTRGRRCRNCGIRWPSRIP